MLPISTAEPVHRLCCTPLVDSVQGGFILVPRAYDLFCQRWDRRALVSAITDRSQKPLSMRELFPPSMLQNGGRQIRFCHVV